MNPQACTGKIEDGVDEHDAFWSPVRRSLEARATKGEGLLARRVEGDE